ncbi:MAG: glycosyltransferase [Candidatus Eisenbacteria bacterium]|jgi:glycosyltransferase involved in cell wall biosynthesis|nr:glycosyltransferase [Candidatus Eisenbacteria bacterium]
MLDRFLSLADLFPPERFGGSERVILELTRALAHAGCTAGVMAGGRHVREPDATSAVAVWRYRVRTSPLPVLFATSFLRLRSIRRLPVVADGGALLLHHPLSAWGALQAGHGRYATPVGFFYGPIDEEWAWHWRHVRRLGSRGLVSPLLQGVIPPLLRTVQRAALRQTQAIIVLGSYTERLVKKLVPEGPEVFVVPPGVDLQRFHPASGKAEAKRAIGIDPASDVLLSVRRLVPRMGISTLLEALWILRRTRPSVRLVLVGTGELAPRLMREAAALGLADCLTLAGHVGDAALADYYRAADVFVLPSAALEGFGLVTLEALASGVPVVGTTIGETPSVIGDAPHIGALVPPADSRAMADACRAVLEGSFSPEACRGFASRFSWATMASSVRSIAAGASR